MLINKRKAEMNPTKIILGLLLGSLVLFIVIKIFLTPSQAAELNINTKILSANLQKCQYEYQEAAKTAENKLLIDVDGDECLDAFDICLVKCTNKVKSECVKDTDYDGVPDDCDYLANIPDNYKGTQKYSLRALCEKASTSNQWSQETGKCCEITNADIKNSVFCNGIK